jgi:tryptophanyl-tRNA synthetase
MKKRVFSGARPTGRQHLGNLLGAIHNYIALQNEESFDCIYCVVDYHALTSLEETGRLQQNIREMVLDWLAAGLDPEKSILFVQSHVPEVLELHAMLSMVTPLGWLMRVPTFKEKARQQPENVNYGLVGYPVLMAADIVLYKAEVVPIGDDQLPHLELAREIARRFNHLFGQTFPEPQARLTEFTRVVGLDGKDKMGKSYDNTIEMAATPEETVRGIMSAVTDPARRYRNDPGHPEVCNVFSLHKYFTAEQVDDIAAQCRAAKIGCVDCKRLLAECVNAQLAPLRERRAKLEEQPERISDILADGAERARVIARETLREAKQNMGLI